jgi:predicted metal-binding membrane protein
MLTLEPVLRRPLIPVLAGIAATVALCWAYLIPASLDMYGAMDGLSAWMMKSTWDDRYMVMIFLMWAVMMTGMMLPSAAPAILLYGAIVRSRPHPERPVARSYAFAAGYLLAWLGFSVAATFSQWRLAEAALLSPMMESRSPVLGGVLLIMAGGYQWTPFKKACLHQCRSPIDYLSRHWRPGVRGALRMGIGHGLYCLGCCWALMLLLFFGGVMSLLWIAGITLFVLLEKLAPFGDRGGQLSGLLLMAAGAWLLAMT